MNESMPISMNHFNKNEIQSILIYIMDIKLDENLMPLKGLKHLFNGLYFLNFQKI